MTPEAKVDRQNRGLAHQLFGWVFASKKSNDNPKDRLEPQATQGELNGIRAITGSSKQNNLDDAKKKVGEWHLNDDGYMVQGKSDRQPFTDDDDGWYLDEDGIMKQR
jgi:hypothetical protein